MLIGGKQATWAREREVQCEFDIAANFETPMGAGNWLLEEPKGGMQHSGGNNN